MKKFDVNFYAGEYLMASKVVEAGSKQNAYSEAMKNSNAGSIEFEGEEVYYVLKKDSITHATIHEHHEPYLDGF